MKNTLTLLLIILSTHFVSAQQPALQLAYDEAGNRVLRKVITVWQQPNSGKTDSSAIGSLLSEQNLSVYPNPVVASLNIESTIAIEGASLQLFNAAGQVVYQAPYGGNAHHIEMSELPTGNYILHLRTKEEEYTWQVLKQ